MVSTLELFYHRLVRLRSKSQIKAVAAKAVRRSAYCWAGDKPDIVFARITQPFLQGRHTYVYQERVQKKKKNWLYI